MRQPPITIGVFYKFLPAAADRQRRNRKTERKRNIIRNDQIVGISGRVSFKDENDAEILLEDVVPIEDIARLGRRRGGYRDNSNGYSDRQNGDYRNGSQNGAMPQKGSSAGMSSANSSGR